MANITNYLKENENLCPFCGEIIAKRERGSINFPVNPKAKTLHKIAIAFNMTLSEFLDYPELNSYCFEDDSDE